MKLGPGPFALLLVALGVTGEAAVPVRVSDVPLPAAPLPAASEVKLARDSQGTLYAAWLAPDNDSSPAATAVRVAVWRSSDGGQRWSDVSPADPGEPAALLLAASGAGSVALGWVDGPGTRPVSVMRSVDGGSSWSAPLASSILSRSLTEAALAAGPAGEVAVAGLSGFSGLDATVAVALDPSAFGPATTVPGVGSTRVDRVAVEWPRSDALLLFFSQIDASRRAGVHLARSSDRGATFAPALTIAPTPDQAYSLDVEVWPGSPAHVLVAWTSNTEVGAAVSIDDGLTWLPPDRLQAGPSLRPARATVDDNATFYVATLVSSEPRLFRLRTGGSWVTLPPPRELVGCTLLPAIALAGGATDRVAIASGAWVWPSIDAGLTWGALRSIAPSLVPVHDQLVRREPGARLVAMWWEGTAWPPVLRAASSVDDGVTWSPAQTVSDAAPASHFEFPNGGVTEFLEPPAPRFDLTATPAGGFVAVWVADSGPACAELRASSSGDGLTWLPSVALGTLDGYAVSVTSDPGGVVVAAWPEGHQLWSARSTDGGLSWSLPALIAAGAPGSDARPGRLAIADDGSILVAAAMDTPTANLTVWRSTDQGLTWPVAKGFGGRIWRPVLATAGPRVALLDYEDTCGCEIMGQERYSIDQGRTWSSCSQLSFAIDQRIVGGSDGTFYAYGPGAGIFGKSDCSSYAWEARLPGADGPVSIVEMAPGEVGYLFSNWTRIDPPGVFFSRGDCATPVPAALSSPAVCGGGPVTLRVDTPPEPGLTWRWLWNGDPIPGANGPTLDVTAVPGDLSTYEAEVGNACGAATAGPIFIVTGPPFVTASPAAQAVCVGRPLALDAAGVGVETWQWRKDGLELPGEAAPDLVRASAVPADAGVYDCLLGSRCGSSVTLAAQVFVAATAPAVTGGPVDAVACPGATVAFQVAADEAVSYRWRRNGLTLAGASSAELILPGVSAADEADYDCVIGNGCGDTLSPSARLAVLPAPAIVTGPADVLACEGASASLTVVASSAWTWQWRRDGVPIPGANLPRLDLPLVVAADAGLYDCLVTGCTTVTSPGARLEVDRPVAAVGASLLLVRTPSGGHATWIDVAGARDYELREDASKDGPFATPAGSAPDGASGADWNPPSGLLRLLRVAGRNGCGSGPLL